MNIVQRKVTPGRTPHCANPGCIHSARYEAIFLQTEHVLLCSKCAKAWTEAYDNALRGWPDEPAHELAESHRQAVA